MNEDKKYITFKNRMKEVEELFETINFEEANEIEAKYQINDKDLVKQFASLNDKPEELYYKLVEFMDPNNKDMVLSSKYGCVDPFLSKKRFDNIAVECLMMERFLEFGMFADLYSHEFGELAPVPKFIVELVQNGELATIKYLFDYNDSMRNKMIATFFNYSYCIPEITDKFKNDNISYLDSTKEKLEKYYFDLLNISKKNRDHQYEMEYLKQLNTIQMLDFITNKADENGSIIDFLKSNANEISNSLIELDTDSNKVKVK